MSTLKIHQKTIKNHVKTIKNHVKNQCHAILHQSVNDFTIAVIVHTIPYPFLGSNREYADHNAFVY